MSRKNNLRQFQNIVNGDMSQASITSSVTNLEFLDNIGVQLNFTGSPTGSIAIQVSADYVQDVNGRVLNPGHWVTIASASTSGGSPIYFDIQMTSAPWMRVVYTKSSGSGTLNGFITAKMV